MKQAIFQAGFWKPIFLFAGRTLKIRVNILPGSAIFTSARVTLQKLSDIWRWPDKWYREGNEGMCYKQLISFNHPPHLVCLYARMPGSWDAAICPKLSATLGALNPGPCFFPSNPLPLQPSTPALHPNTEKVLPWMISRFREKMPIFRVTSTWHNRTCSGSASWSWSFSDASISSAIRRPMAGPFLY